MRIKIFGKTADSFCMQVRDIKKDNALLLDYYGYPPVRNGISQDGDGIQIVIDNDTGSIIGWVPLSLEDLEGLRE